MLRFLRKHGPCPALEWSDTESRYICGLIARPAHYLPLPVPLQSLARRVFARGIAAGKGCDCTAELAD